MRQLSKYFSVVMMLVVIFLTTGQSFVAERETDSCCSKAEVNEEDSCNETKEEGCANEGNPFRFCNCCPHIWAHPAYVVIQPQSPTVVSALNTVLTEDLPEGLSNDFWQPPRFS